jgi:hypothetical protein
MTRARRAASGAAVLAVAVATVALMERIAATGPAGLAAGVLLMMAVIGAAGLIGRTAGG